MNKKQIRVLIICSAIAFALLFFLVYIILPVQLVSDADCWKCNTLLDTGVTNLRETIASVGMGDVGSMKYLATDFGEFGSCLKSVYIRQMSASEGFDCRAICPNHPNKCWVIFSERLCGDESKKMICIDISGDMKIESDILNEIGSVSGLLVSRTEAYTLKLTVE
jgi:hypothetical protein